MDVFIVFALTVLYFRLARGKCIMFLSLSVSVVYSMYINAVKFDFYVTGGDRP